MASQFEEYRKQVENSRVTSKLSTLTEVQNQLNTETQGLKIARELVKQNPNALEVGLADRKKLESLLKNTRDPMLDKFVKITEGRPIFNTVYVPVSIKVQGKSISLLAGYSLDKKTGNPLVLVPRIPKDRVVQELELVSTGNTNNLTAAGVCDALDIPIILAMGENPDRREKCRLIGEAEKGITDFSFLQSFWYASGAYDTKTRPSSALVLPVNGLIRQFGMAEETLQKMTPEMGLQLLHLAS
jgi:hypothetical protein